MDLRIIEMMRYARVPFELNTKSGDRVLIVTDTRMDPLVWQALAAACREVGGEVTVAIITPREVSGHEPPPEVAAAMKAADLNVLAASRSLAHTRARLEAAKAGAAHIWMDSLTPEMLMHGATADDYRKMEALGERLCRLWDEGERVRMTSAAGTDLTASVKGRKGFYIAGLLQQSPYIAGKRCGFPDGECGIAPVEGTCNGVVVWDVSADGLGGLDEPIRLTVEKSFVRKIEGGRQARELEELLRAHGDENSLYLPGEISIGLNPSLKFIGNIRTDKKAYGGVHVGIGTNADIGGTIRSITHIDGVCRGCTLTIDDRVVLNDGVITV
ncbi:MAG: aminopeptidase [Armatimonadetes bacterium]|nr:aminopeptidase [Armatimonadota bacterium]